MVEVIPGSPEWFARIEAEWRARNLTACHNNVLKALGGRIALGLDEPSEAEIAAEAGCSVRTVQRAKARARELGLLQWDRRFAWEGGRRIELTCRYRTEMPAGPVLRRERQSGRPPSLKGTSYLHKNTYAAPQRSIEAQIAALGHVTPAMLAMQSERKRRLGLPT